MLQAANEMRKTLLHVQGKYEPALIFTRQVTSDPTQAMPECKHTFFHPYCVIELIYVSPRTINLSLGMFKKSYNG